MYKSLIAIFILSLILRTYGLNWDQGFHLHPDERFLTMVGNAMQFNNYFNTGTSLLNPHNLGFDFYVYGTWPVILTKIISRIFTMDNYDQLILVGRFLSALFDSGTAVLVFLIARNIFKNKLVSILSALFYSFSVLPIQLSHFFAVDAFLVFFTTLTLYLLLTVEANPILLGLSYGLAVSAKISALVFAPIILLAVFLFRKNIKNTLKYLILFSLSLLISIRVFYPYLFDGFLLNQKVIQNWQVLKSYDNPQYFPPAVQWVNTLPYIFPLANTILFGLGLPLGILFMFSLTSFRNNVYKYRLTWLLYFWIFILFLYQGSQFAKPLRYLYPFYPAVCILSGYFISGIKNLKVVLGVCILVMIWSLGFLSIYSRPHPRVQASNWILKNIPSGSKISCEYWDDCLPLFNYQNYITLQISPYDPDNIQKIKTLVTQISGLDYLIFSSNRLYGSIPSDSSLFPYTSKIYADLFSGKIGFEKVAEFTSRPNWPIPGIKLCLTPPFFNYGFVSKVNQSCTLPGITLVDDYADETFTVYDHPKVVIFKNINR